MKNYICTTCGVQYEASQEHPSGCKICLDERQFVPATGQEWTTLDKLRESDYRNEFIEVEPNVIRITTYPQFGIGQSAYLIRTPEGNILWDCITFLDSETVQKIQDMGGLRAIAISHPHYYSTTAVWAETFDCPVYIHEADQEWIARKSDYYVFWEGEELSINTSCELIHLGGHFEGSSVLLWKNGAQSEGALFVGDTIFIVPDSGWVSFMYSYPNRIPLPATVVKGIKERISNYHFNNIYGAFGNSILENGKDSVIKSAERYIKHLEK